MAATGGGDSVRVIADVLGRAGEGQGAYCARRVLLMLKVGFDGEGARRGGRWSSSESCTASARSVVDVGEVPRRAKPR